MNPAGEGEGTGELEAQATKTGKAGVYLYAEA